MEKRQGNQIQCEIYQNPCKFWLEKVWMELEKRSNASVFLSWTWIGTWIDCFVHDYYLIEAKQYDKTVGLGIFIKSTKKLFGIPYKSRYFLHRVGVKDYDQIWIEYNDFLLDKEDESAIRTKMLEHIFYNLSKSDAIVVGASDERKFSHIENLGLIKRTIWETSNFAIDLNKIRINKQTFLQYLSRNSRYQIQRSIRKYQKQYGEITIEKASSFKQAKDMFLFAKPLHIARWNKKPDKSGFTNQEFIKFHEKLIEKGIANNCLELYHIKAGDNTLSIMYNFKYNNSIYFYLCAINYEYISAQFKPGLVSHYFLINKALNEGIEFYDFMGGASRYKRSLSNIEGNLSVNVYEPSNLMVSLLRFFRDSKLKINKKRKLREINSTN